jgi:hypothetical protein
MTRQLRTFPAILAGALVLVTTTTLEPAIAAGSSPTRLVTAAKPTAAPSNDHGGALLQVTPAGDARTSGVAPRVVVAVDPGASTSGSFVVVNRSADLVLTVGFATVDATALPGGAFRYASSAPAGSPATWVTLSDVIATLQPGARLPVSLTITPPANAAPGTAIAGVVVHVHDAVRAADQTAVHADATATVPVAITVKGAPTAVVSITGVRVVDTNGRTDLAITFQNGGATPNTMSGRVQARGPRPYTETFSASVAPLTQTTVRVPFRMARTVTAVPISVVATDAGGDQATWTGTVGAADPPTASSAPTKGRSVAVARRASARVGGSVLARLGVIVVACVFVAAAVWFGAELRRNRRVRRARRRPELTPAASGASGVADTAVGPDPMGAVAAQLGALADAIDRLVGRLDVPSPSHAGPATPAAASTATDADAGASTVTRAAPRVPVPSADDLYDWPTEAQLDAFSARRRAAGDLR